MKRLILIILSLIIIAILGGCGEKRIPSEGINKYIYEKINNSSNKEIKIEVEDIFMVRQGYYLAKVILDEDKNKLNIPAYDLYLGGVFSGDNINYELKEPPIYYTKEKNKYIIIKDNGWVYNDMDLDKVPQYQVQIYIPESSLNSMPYATTNNKGSTHTDPNVKITE